MGWEHALGVPRYTEERARRTPERDGPTPAGVAAWLSESSRLRHGEGGGQTLFAGCGTPDDRAGPLGDLLLRQAANLRAVAIRALAQDEAIANTAPAQAARRHLRGPNSTGPVEEIHRQLARRLSGRVANCTNQTRMNQLLMLYALDINGWASEHTWADLIREHLEARGGVPPPAIADPLGMPSLR